MIALQSKVVDIIVHDEAVAYVNPRSAPAAPTRRRMQGRVYIASSRGPNGRKTRLVSFSGCDAPPIPFPACRVTFQNVQNINITGRVSKSEYQYSLQSSDTDTLYRIAPQMSEPDREDRRHPHVNTRSLHQPIRR